MRVIDWISYDEAEQIEHDVGSIGGLGGYFNFSTRTGMRWSDYLDGWHEHAHPYLEAIRAEVVAKNMRNGGNWHQRDGVPLFEDGKVGLFSMRAWGDLMAAIWSEEEDRDYCYTDFAWND